MAVNLTKQGPLIWQHEGCCDHWSALIHHGGAPMFEEESLIAAGEALCLGGCGRVYPTFAEHAAAQADPDAPAHSAPIMPGAPRKLTPISAA
ncbi:hypothetical protein [Kitasatospora sp. NPDC094016]|uniref:hypothetical protein n=1 Tax=Kitasatospora sp. NPDC094016 TaxID=3154986 RepID=UPI00332DA209